MPQFLLGTRARINPIDTIMQFVYFDALHRANSALFIRLPQSLRWWNW